MGKASIVSEYGAGQYLVDIDYNSEKLSAMVANLENRIIDIDLKIVEIDALILQAETEAEIGMLRAERRTNVLLKLSTQKRIDFIGAYAASTKQVTAWCADYTENLSGIVATMQAPGDGDAGTVQIVPGYADNAAWAQDVDGIDEHAATMTPAACFYNLAMKPGVQKWLPKYRNATITAIDHENNKADVELDAATATKPGNDIEGADLNQVSTLSAIPFQYMACNHAAFNVGDAVVVEFRNVVVNQGFGDPYVIGFQHNPKLCFLAAYAYARPEYDGSGWYLVLQVNTSTYTKLYLAPEEAIQSVYAISFARSTILRIAMIVHLNSVNGVYPSGRFATITATVDPVTFEMTAEHVYYYGLGKHLGYVDQTEAHQLTTCTGEAINSTTPASSALWSVDMSPFNYTNNCSPTHYKDCEWVPFFPGRQCRTRSCCVKYVCTITGETLTCGPCFTGGYWCWSDWTGRMPGWAWCSFWNGVECEEYEWKYHRCSEVTIDCENESFDLHDCDGQIYPEYGDMNCFGSPEICGQMSTTFTSLAGPLDWWDCRMYGPTPFGVTVSGDSEPVVYLAGTRTADGRQPYTKSGTVCVDYTDTCSCTKPYTGDPATFAGILAPWGVPVSPGTDLFAVPASQLADEYNISRFDVVDHPGQVQAVAPDEAGEDNICASLMVTTHRVGMVGPLVVDENEIAYRKRVMAYTRYENQGWSSATTVAYDGVMHSDPDFVWPTLPDGFDPLGTEQWFARCSIRSDAGRSIAFVFGNYRYMQTYCEGLCQNKTLELASGLAAPLDHPERLVVLVASGEQEPFPGIAIDPVDRKIYGFGSWSINEDGKLEPSGSVVVEMPMRFSLSNLEGQVALWVGLIEGVNVPP